MMKKLLLSTLVVVAFFAGYYCVNASAYAGRADRQGYFLGNFDTSGDFVFRPYFAPGPVSTGCEPDGTRAIPMWVSSKALFIGYIKCKLNSNATFHVQREDRTGAAFVIQTMLGTPGPAACELGPANNCRPTDASIAKWETFVNNPAVSVNWNNCISWTVNSLYQGNPVVGNSSPNDDVFYTSGGSSCEVITFTWPGGTYAIKRFCGNPVSTGEPQGLPTPPQYNLQPSITATVGGAPVSGGVEAGQTIQFVYSVRNTTSAASPPGTNCTIYTNVFAGYTTARSNPPPGGGAGPPTGCPMSFAGNSNVTLGAPENVPVLAGNQTICRSLFVSPASPTVALLGVEACVPVVQKPYLKVYGGDISAGNGQTSSPGVCAPETNAAVIGWNRRTGAGFAGAGAGYAIAALSTIFDTASAQAGGASAGGGLSFRNTSVDLANGDFGGVFGSLPCIQDYYGMRPASPLNFTNLPSANVSGAYAPSGPGPFSLFGSVSPGGRITVFVLGDLNITNDVTYPASWTSGNPPLLEVVVKGNIYIRNTVTQVDGVYIAQPNGGSGGVIYTCATAAGAVAPGPGLNASCGNKLTINGAFVARDVQFLRTSGTQQQAVAAEGSGSANIAEVFNYSPVLWMAQPVGLSGATDYDAITALPPIL